MSGAILLASAGILLPATLASAVAQPTEPLTTQPTSEQSPPATQPTATTAVESSPNDNQDQALLEQKVDDLQSRVNYVTTAAGILIAIIASGGVLGFVLSYREERRTSKAFSLTLTNDARSELRASEMFSLAKQSAELAIKGESSAQRRSDEIHQSFFASAQTTLSLVNDTLELARQASERAAKSLEERSKAILNTIEDRCRAAFGRVIRSGEFKKIVEDNNLSGAIQEIATELASVEGYLRVQDIRLPDICLFVRGMDRHLKEVPKVAIRELRQAADGTSDMDLRMMANYWIAYESNNIGDYAEAAEVFGRMAKEDGARSLPRTYELERIATESRFFELATNYGPLDSRTDETRQQLVERVENCERKLTELSDALFSLDSEFADVRRQVGTTRGNVLTWLGRVQEDGGAPRFEEAIAAFEEAGGDLWGPFGRLEALQFLGRPIDEEAYQAIAERVMVRITERVEPRSKVLLLSTRLIAVGRQRDRPISDVEALLGDCHLAMERVNPTMKVYSQFRRCNVGLVELSTELREFFDESKALRHGGKDR